MYLYAREGLGQSPTTLQSRNITGPKQPPQCQIGVSGPAKQAIMATARGAANTPLEGWQPYFHGAPVEHRKFVYRTRRPVARGAGGVAGYDGLSGFGAPLFTINCANPPGCPPLAADRCNPVIRDAINEAIRLATNAAQRIESVLAVAPADRNAEQRETAHLFRFFFGHDPLHQSRGPALEDSGVSIAKRFRAVARELDGGRRVSFDCRPDRAGCGNDLTCCDPGDNAWFHPGVPNSVTLCSGFWNPPATLRGLPHRTYRAAIIVHEMTHMLFHGVIGDTVRGRARAACYEAFALRIAGFGADRVDVCACTGRC